MKQTPRRAGMTMIAEVPEGATLHLDRSGRVVVLSPEQPPRYISEDGTLQLWPPEAFSEKRATRQ